jgi:transposase
MSEKRGRPFAIEWKDEEETLRSHYKREANSELRPRLQSLWLLRTGRSLEQVSEVVGCHYSTLQQWVAWYRQGGVEEVRRHKRGGRQGRSAYLTLDQDQQVIEAAAQGSFRTAGEIGEWIERQFGVKYRSGSLYSLAERLGLTVKVPRPLSEKADLSRQEAWKKGA